MLIKSTKLSILLCIFISQIVYAGVYKWTDANGKIHFSDKPHKNAAQITIKASKPSGIGVNSKQLKRQKELLLQYQNERITRQNKQKKINKRNTVIANKCKRLKNIILNYEDVDYLYTRNDAGKKKNLSSQRKKQETEKLKKAYADKCT